MLVTRCLLRSAGVVAASSRRLFTSHVQKVQRSPRSARVLRYGAAFTSLAAFGSAVGAVFLFAADDDDDDEPVIPNAQFAAASVTRVAKMLNVAEDDVYRFVPHLRERIFPRKPMEVSPATICKAVDHTLLKQNATAAEVNKLCKEAVKYGFAAVCVNGSRVLQAAQFMRDAKSDVRVAAVVGFPLGASSIEAKAAETIQVIRDGADEVDMVINVGMLKDRNFHYVLADISRVVMQARASSRPVKVKVILECGALSKEEIADACLLSVIAHADFVKTSTGFGPGGATVGDVALMKYMVGNAADVKASGGVRSFSDAVAMIRAGAARLGTSSGVAIAQQSSAGGSGY